MSKNTVTESVTIKAPAFHTVEFNIRGTAPLVINSFSKKASDELRERQERGGKAKVKTREPKDFEACYEGAKHVSTEGWVGFPASAVRCACVNACKLVGFPMTLAKLSVFVLADGIDRVDGVPLFRVHGDTEMCVHHVRNATGVVDIRARCMIKEWTAKLRIRFDSDQFTTEDVSNLVNRAGIQCGFGEGRPNSKNSCGMGWGTFEIVGDAVTDAPMKEVKA